MKAVSLVERIRVADRAAMWIVTNRGRFAPTLWLVAALTPIAVFWIGPLALQDTWVRDARSAHRAWIDSGHVLGARAMAPTEFLTGLRQPGPPPHLPELSSSGLEIVRTGFVPPVGGRAGAIHVGYANEAGCRISLWITAAGDMDASPLIEQHRGIAFSWRVDGLRYVIVRSDMRQERFHLIAESARETTLARDRLRASKRVALAMSAMFGRPCTS